MALDVFQSCDQDGNSRLDADEFLKCTERKAENVKPVDTTAHVLRYFNEEMFYLMTHSTHFIYGYMASDIW